jgi:transposase
VNNCIGIDVSKSSLNVHITKTNKDLQIDNSPKALKSLYSKLKKIYKKEIGEIIFIFEPTGSYSEVLRKFCSEKDIRSFIINPRQSANYAKALGEEVKNDEVDARVLAKAITVAKERQIAVPHYDNTVEQIKELMSFYKFTVKQTTQLRNHLESLESKNGDRFAIKELKNSIKFSKEKEKKILQKVQTIIDDEEEMNID